MKAMVAFSTIKVCFLVVVKFTFYDWNTEPLIGWNTGPLCAWKTEPLTGWDIGPLKAEFNFNFNFSVCVQKCFDLSPVL